jgi:hypothetical protein
VKALLLTVSLLSSSAFAADLAGKWLNTSDRSVMNFTRIGRDYNEHTTVQYSYPNGLPAYTFAKVLTAHQTSENSLKGKIDFVDSRGCSFRQYPVTLEFKDNNLIHVQMTVPHYQIGGCAVLNYTEISFDLMRL